MTNTALHLVKHVWSHCPRGSWRRLNNAMHAATKLAIESGMHWAKADFRTIAKTMRLHRWGNTENFYRIAITVGNLSAAQSIEAYLKRPPFIVDTGWPYDTGRRRAAVWTPFVWCGERVKVTSFADDGSHLVACSYHPSTYTAKGGCGRDKVRRRYTITRDDIRAERGRRKAAMQATGQDNAQAASRV